MLLAGPAEPLSARAEGVRARKGSSQPGLRFPRRLSSSNRALPGGDRSSGVQGVEKEAPWGGGAPRGPRRSPEGLPEARARSARPAPSPSSRPPPMMAGSRLRVWRSLRLERLLAAAGAAAAGEEQEKTLLSKLCADIAVGAAPGTAGRPGVLPGLSLPLPPAPATAERRGAERLPGCSPGRAQPPAARPDGGTAGLMAAAGAGAAPGLPPARSLCWEGEGGKKKKKVTREKGRENGSSGAFIWARRRLPESLPSRPRCAAPHTHGARRVRRWRGPCASPHGAGRAAPGVAGTPESPRDAQVGDAGEAAPPGCAGTGAAGSERSGAGSSSRRQLL